LPIVTIDGETARDFDDAVLVRPLANGNWELQVHIADVSHYVRPGTALDLEARLRGTRFTFRIVRFRCCRRSFRAACAACGRMRTGWC
jgi:exoribonuclease II